MPVTHGSASESGDHVDPFTWAPPALSELNAARPAEGSVLSAALQRASAERHAPRPARASFDNNLTGPPADTRG